MKKMNISDAELEVLKEFWAESPLTSRRLVDRLRARKQWGEPTIKTLLLRLLRKKAVKRQLKDKVFVYAATVGREEYQCSIGRSVIDRVFDGGAGSLLHCLIRNGALRPGELEELRRLLDEETPETSTGQ